MLGEIPDRSVANLCERESRGSPSIPFEQPCYSYPSDCITERLPSFCESDAFVSDRAPTANFGMPGTEQRRRLHRNVAKLRTNVGAALHVENDAECFRQQLRATILDRDNMHERLILLEQRKNIEPDMWECLKSEFQAISRLLQQQVKDEFPTVANEVRKTMQGEIMRLTSIISQASSVEIAKVLEAVQRLRAETPDLSKMQAEVMRLTTIISQASSQEESKLSEEVQRLREEIPDLIRRAVSELRDVGTSQSDVDFAVVLRAIREQTFEMNSSFSSMSRQIKDCIEVATKPGLHASCSVDVSTILQELKSSRQEFEGSQSLAVSMRKLFFESRADLESSLLSAIGAIARSVPMNDQFAQVHDAIRQQKDGITDALRDAIERKDKRTSMHDSYQFSSDLQETRQLLKRTNDTFHVNFDPLLTQLRCLQDTTQQQQHHLEGVSDRLSRLHELLQQRQIEFNEKTRRSHDANAKDMHLAMPPRTTPASIEDLSQLLNQMNETLEKVWQNQKGTDFASFYDAIQRNGDALLSMQQRSTSSVDADMAVLLKQNSETLQQVHLKQLSIYDAIQQQKTSTIMNENVRQLLEQVSCTLQQQGQQKQIDQVMIQPLHEAIWSNKVELLDAMRHRDPPAANEEIRTSLMQFRRTLRDIQQKQDTTLQTQDQKIDQLLTRSFHEALKSNNEELLKALERRETLAINEDVSQLLNQLSTTLEQVQRKRSSLKQLEQKQIDQALLQAFQIAIRSDSGDLFRAVQQLEAVDKYQVDLFDISDDVPSRTQSDRQDAFMEMF